ncbi:hypothetical protein CVT25_008811 [Psilocybe cyanescens]|uniref:Cyanovirin-N domain-containing protein n=1 Tax=Psilocybe cyanescens TaxID=93625 RepID=A0A409XNA4_PSICY|nr:hypothetical protein CVT25_008811 [Psilocybe cyanescens]
MHFSLAYAALATVTSLYLSGVVAQTSSCWAPAANVDASYGTLAALRVDTAVFCNQYATGPAALSSAGRFIFGFQSAAFLGNFASNASCVSTFNTLVTDCYGTANPNRPVSLGGVRVDPGGAELIISFGNGVKL